MILAIDTATQMIGLALHDGVSLIAETHWRSRNHHTVELAPGVKAMLDRAEIPACELSAIALPTGPGSYTGLRIGMALAKGMSVGCTPHLPLIGIPTLDILAEAQPHLADHFIAVAQAGRRRINTGHYRREGAAWIQSGELAITTWDDLLEAVERPTQIAGEIGADALEKLTTEEGIFISPAPMNLRRAGVLAEMAWRRFRAGDLDDPATLAPFYLR